MLKRFLAPGLGVLLASSGQAADAPAPNRFTLGPAWLWGVQADFTRLGGLARQTDPGPATAGAEHFYDDGFNRVDSTGNGLGLTTFFGYTDRTAQVVSGGTQLELHSASVLATGQALGAKAGSSAGYEFGYRRELGTAAGCRWGLDFHFTHVPFGIRDQRTLATDATVIADRYTIPGAPPIILPATPPAYVGPFTGTGAEPSIGDAPTRLAPTTLASGAVTTGTRELRGDLFGFRLGPSFEADLGQWTVHGGGGLAMSLVRSEFSVNDTTSIAGVVTATQLNQGRSEVLGGRWGGYVESGLTYRLSPAWSVSAAGTYHWMQALEQDAGTARARLKLSGTILLRAGLIWSF